MTIRDLYALITTPRLAEVRAFHTERLGAAVVFEAEWFLMLSLPGEAGRGLTLAYMHPDHPSRPPGPEAFNGLGMILTLQVDDAPAAFARLQDAAPIVHPLTDEVWGQRRFMLRDPAGVLIDVVEQIEPAPGFWERYSVPS